MEPRETINFGEGQEARHSENDRSEHLERHFRWEFLRRNSQYQKDFADLVKRLGGSPMAFAAENRRVWLALYMHSHAEVEKQFPQTNISQVRERFIALARFKEKWCVVSPQDPAQDRPPHFFSSGRPSSPIEVLVAKEDLQKAQTTNDPQSLYCRVDLRSSSEEILAQMKELLELSQQKNAEAQAPTLLEPKWVRLQHSLSLFDAVVLRKQSLENAAAAVFPGLAADQDPQRRQKILDEAREMLDEAKRLVTMAESPQDLQDSQARSGVQND